MRMRRWVAGLVLKVIVLTAGSSLPSAAGIPARALLGHLEGSWRMTGTVMKKPVVYNAEGKWELSGGFLSFHMKDAAPVPAYEANVYIGIDSAGNEYVAHWLDSFGGAGARVVGTGPLSAEKIEIVYPYAEGKFRNIFRYDKGKDRWTLLIETEGAGGRWSVFAEYRIVRKD